MVNIPFPCIVCKLIRPAMKPNETYAAVGTQAPSGPGNLPVTRRNLGRVFSYQAGPWKNQLLFWGEMGVSENSGTSKSSHFNRVFHYKPSILGFHYLWKHPNEQRNKPTTFTFI